MKLFKIYFNDENDNAKKLDIIAINEKDAKFSFVKNRRLDIDKITDIKEIPNKLSCIDGEYEILYRKLSERKEVKFGGIEFGEINEIIQKGY